MSVITDEDREAIERMTWTDRCAGLITNRETECLEEMYDQETMTQKQRAWFERICERVLK